MNHRHTITLPIGQASIQVEVDYSWTAGRPATREQPEEGDSFDIETVFVVRDDGTKECAPFWLFEIVESDEGVAAELLSEAVKDHQCAADDHADMLREERALGL
jgi:hypothetical protein